MLNAKTKPLVREARTKVVIIQGHALKTEDRENLKKLWRNFSSFVQRPRADHFRFLQAYRQNIYFLLVSEEDGSIIGTATLVPNMSSQKWYASLEDLVIDPDYRQLGYGQEFLRQIMHWVEASDDYFFLQTSVHPARTEMNQLCLKMGMRMVARAAGHEPGDVNVFRLVLVASE